MKNLKEKKYKSTAFSRGLLTIQGPTWLFRRVQVHWLFFFFFTATYTTLASGVLTCRYSRLCSSSSESDSWVFLASRTSSQARWSGVVSLSTPYRCRDRRAAHVCTQGARGQKIGAGPCCSGIGCTGLICLKAWYTLTHIQCAASGTSHPRCRLWLRPSTGLLSKGPDQSLQRG